MSDELVPPRGKPTSPALLEKLVRVQLCVLGKQLGVDQVKLSTTRPWPELYDPLSNPKPEKKDIKFSQEQTHNILTPYYRTVEEPWDQQTASDPRVTLAAMFKANSNKFREDSAARQCSRSDCQYRTDCYWEREWEQRQGRGLYHYTQCV